MGIIIETIIGIISTIITSVVKRSTHYQPVTQTSSQRPSPYERSVERVAATEPQTNRRDTRKQSGRPRACVERTAAILASRRAAPGLASNEPSDPTSDPMNDPPNDPPSESSPRNRPIRAIRRASRHRRACIERTAAIQASSRATPGLVSNEPPRYEQAVGPPPGLRRTDRRDTRNPPAAAGPAPRIDDTPKRRVRRQLIGKEMEGYVRSSRV